MNDLHYIDYAARIVKDVPYTRDRSMSVSPVFYSTRREALIVLKEYVTELAQESVTKIMEIEKEIAAL